MKRVILLCFLFLSGYTVFAQADSVTTLVTDTLKKPSLPANIDLNVDRLVNKAMALLKKGDEKGAEAYIIKADGQYENNYDYAGLAAMYTGLVNYYRGKSNDKVIQYMTKAAQNYREAGNNALAARSFLHSSNYLIIQKKYTQAERVIIDQTLPQYRITGNQEGRLLCFENLGKLYHEQKMYSQAKWFYLQSISLAQALDFKSKAISSSISLARIKSAQGDDESAINDLKQSISDATKNNLTAEATSAKKELSALYTRQGKPDLAKSALAGAGSSTAKKK